MEKKHKRLKAVIIILLILIFLIYLLFFAYLPRLGKVAKVNTVEISEEEMLKECPEIAVTDYDREFLNKILNAPQFKEIEKNDSYTSASVTADEAGFERYSLRPDENYTVHANYMMYGMFPLSVHIQFEYEGGLYRENLFLSVRKDENGLRYSKAVTVKRSDGKFIKQYWNFHGRYEKKIYTYGLVGYIKSIFDAIMGI